MMYISANVVQFTLGAQCKHVHVTLWKDTDGGCKTDDRTEGERIKMTEMEDMYLALSYAEWISNMI